VKKKLIKLPEVVGGGYGNFWRFKGRYRVVKGSRASKKSKTAALWFIYNMMKYPAANLLVVRKVFRTLKDSCFTELKWAIFRFGVEDLWEIKESPLEMTYIKTGQKIYFRGLDNPQKITSIAVSKGTLCWLWIEEAYEVMNEADFNMLDESIRGQLTVDGGELTVDNRVFKQVTLTFNPWNERHWIKGRFFDVKSSDVLAMTTNYKINEWLDEVDLKLFDDMRVKNPRRYRVAGLGEWGIAEGLIYENWVEEEFCLNDIRRIPCVKSAFGLDFGYTNDPTALFCGMICLTSKRIWVFDELYKKGLSNEAIYAEISKLGYRKERIRADSAEPKSIDRLLELGMAGIKPALKGRDSVNNGIDFIRDFKIIIHPGCVNFLTEISNYTWGENRSGKKVNVPNDDFNHLMDAMRYALEEIGRDKNIFKIIL
jgi:phage terminase large subunit